MLQNFFAKLAGKWIKTKLSLQEGNMDGSKKWWQSQTIWAGVIALIRGIYQVAQVTLPLFTSVHLPPIPPVADAILGSALGTTVIHGRYTADTTIG